MKNIMSKIFECKYIVSPTIKSKYQISARLERNGNSRRDIAEIISIFLLSGLN